MLKSRIAMCALAWVLAASTTAQTSCTAAPLSDDQVRDLIAQARAERADLPPPFAKYRSTVRRDGCYYVYVEVHLPETPDLVHIFRLNQHGRLVDAQAGNE